MDMFLTVIGALNEGFLQTLKLFFVTLIGALPAGPDYLLWLHEPVYPSALADQDCGLDYPGHASDAAAADPLLCARHCPGKRKSLAQRRIGAVFSLCHRVHHQLRPATSRRSSGAGFRASLWDSRRRGRCWHDQVPNLFPCYPFTDGEAHYAPPVQRDHYAGEGYLSGADHLSAGGHLGRYAFIKSSHGYSGLVWPLFFTGVYYPGL